MGEEEKGIYRDRARRKSVVCGEGMVGTLCIYLSEKNPSAIYLSEKNPSAIYLPIDTLSLIV